MSVSKVFSPYAVKLHRLTDESAGAEYIDGVQSVSVSAGTQNLLERGDGELMNTFGALVSADPRASFTTNDLKAVLDKVSSYSAIDSDGTHPGVALYRRRYLSGGSRSTSANAIEALFDKGIMALRSINLPHRGTATCSVEIVGESADGSTAALTLNEAASVPSASPEVAAAWTLGKVDVSGTALEGLMSVTYNPGVTLIQQAADSDIHPTFVAVRMVQPSFSFTARHEDFTSTLTEEGLYDATGVVVYARKRALGGTFTSDATEEHISFTLGKCRINWSSLGGDPGAISGTITPWSTQGGAAPVTIDTTAAIA